MDIVSPVFVFSSLTIQTYCNIVPSVGPSCCDALRQVGVENRTSAHARMPHCCTSLAKRPQHHEKFDHFQISANNTQSITICRNTSHQGGQTHATCYAQQCHDMLQKMLRPFGGGVKHTQARAKHN